MGLYVKTGYPKTLLEKAIDPTVLNIGVISSGSADLTMNEGFA